MEKGSGMDWEEEIDEIVWQRLEEQKDNAKAAIEECDYKLRRYARKLKAVRKKRRNVERQLEGLSRENRTLDCVIDTIGLSHYLKMLQIKLKYHMEISDLISSHQTELVSLVIKQSQAYNRLHAIKARRKKNQDDLDRIEILEEAQWNYEEYQRNNIQIQDSIRNLGIV